MRLYEHQKQALIDSEGHNRVAFFHDMGLGKTYTGAEKMMQLMHGQLNYTQSNNFFTSTLTFKGLTD